MSHGRDELRKKLLDELKAHKTRCITLSRQLNEFARTAVFPNEVMVLIFEAHLENSIPGRRYEELLTLVSVCVRWRDIIMGVPALWSEIRNDWWRGTPTLLERSGNVPINITWDDTDGQWAERYAYLKLALVKAPRLRSLDLAISSFTMKVLLNSTLVGATLPVLHKIDIFSRGDIIAFPVKILARSPTLRELSLCNLSLDMVTLSACQSLPPLESLVLSESTVGSLSDLPVTVIMLSRFTQLRLIDLATVNEKDTNAGGTSNAETTDPFPTAALLPALRDLRITGGTFSSPLFCLPASLTSASPYTVRIELPFWSDHGDNEDISNEWNEKCAAFARVVLRVLSSPSADVFVTNLALSHIDNRLELILHIKDVAGCPWRTITLAQSHAPPQHPSTNDDAIYDQSAFSILLPALCSAPYGRRLRSIELRDNAALDHFATSLATDTESPTPKMLRSGEWDQLKATGGLANMIRPVEKLVSALQQRKRANLGLQVPRVLLSPNARHCSRFDVEEFNAKMESILKVYRAIYRDPDEYSLPLELSEEGEGDEEDEEEVEG